MTLRVDKRAAAIWKATDHRVQGPGKARAVAWLSQKTNNASGIVRLGKLGADGKVVPQPVANGNEVYS